MIGIAITDTDFGIGAAVIVILAFLVYRILRREPEDRIVRVGVFIERMRNGNGDAKPRDEDVYHLDPFTTASEARPSPLPPPTPPPPLPPRPDDETQTWPQREESP